ncbi:MAG: hydantoinase/oxoprolinase family protein [Thaumarchaeota archaeon]|nr:hydantoinase/oxoprolinase family protein [Nitrososphaerota archaeon]
MPVRLAVDIGGTFTDAAALDEETGEIRVAKSSTTPSSPVDGVLACMRKLDLDPRQVAYLVHGTTTATNAIVQRKFQPLALICTKGFGDIIEIQRGNRPLKGLYDIRWEKPLPIVPRFLRYEVEERIDSSGNVVRSLGEEDVRRVACEIRSQGIRTVGVCLLFAYMNPAHEREVRRIIGQECPGVYVSLSSEVNPEIREYERTSTVAIDAAVKPVMDLYIGSLERGLKQAGFASRLMIMKASGGMMSSTAAKETPVQTIESGPAGGTIGAARVADSLGIKNLIAIDMGGTTFKVSLVDSGVPRYRSEGELEWGVPFRMRMIDISEIGAGGGSIAWVDEGGLLRVGPHSAGADPGPVCYGTGGTEPTITDAQLVLGRLDPTSFLGGEMRLDRDAAAAAIERIARQVGLSATEAAAGIIRIAEANMLASMRVNSVEKGYDPRNFSVIAYGGAGPMVASTIARDLGSPTVIIPFHPGIFSAIGMLATEIRFDYMRSYVTRIDKMDLEGINSRYEQLESQARETLAREHSGESQILRTADMRYFGQNYEISAPVPGGKIAQEQLATIVDGFNHEHLKVYGHNKPEEPIELINLRVAIIGKVDKPQFRRKALPGGLSRALKGARDVYYHSAKGFLASNVYDREYLPIGELTSGPAIIEEMDSTTVINPDQTASIDDHGNIVIRT